MNFDKSSGRGRDVRRKGLSVSAAVVAVAWSLMAGQAAYAAEPGAQPEDDTRAVGVGEIVVTAQKRAQNVNDVPMTITAATGDQLALSGVKNAADLGKITPGFSFGQSNIGAPVYTLRGVGFNDVAIAARPAVTVYLDEAPMPFAQQTIGAGFDVEHVEVLKGPQGTLFGNNSTGGAINYVANKPTDTLEGGGTFTYGRFNEADIEGYVSGPVTDTLSFRAAVQHLGHGDWQKSYTRNDTHGRQDFTNGRFILAWKPTTSLRAQLTVNRWVDRSDTPAVQAFAINPQVPVPALITLTGVDKLQVSPSNPRAADWDPNKQFVRNNRMFQVSGRVDYDLTNQLTLTSITNYIHLRLNYLMDADGVPIESASTGQVGFARSFSQELRVAGKFDKGNFVLGGTFASDTSDDDVSTLISGGTLGIALSAPDGKPWNISTGRANQRSKTYAAFASGEYNVTDQLTLQGGARYTQYDLKALSCATSLPGANSNVVFNTIVNASRAAAGLPPIAPPATNECASIIIAIPGLTPLTQGGWNNQLNQHNLSWRVGLQYKVNSDTLLYANVSKGYKGGAFSSFGSLFTDAYTPVVQESVLSYEAGFKASLLDRKLQVNGAGFYMDYKNKQVLANVVDPVLGTIAELRNIPKSRIYGAELQVIAAPTDGLTLSAAGSYINAKVNGDYVDGNADQIQQQMNGTPLPYAPEWMVNAAVRYSVPVRDNLNGFAGVNFSYQSESFSYLGGIDRVRLKPYSLTDLQAGVETPDGNIRAYLWGRNIFNTYYWTAAARLLDTSSRWVSMGATYGATISFKIR